MLQVFCSIVEVSSGDFALSWKEPQKMVDKDHRHVFEHSKYLNIKILLERNNLWSNEVEKYLCRVPKKCSSYSTTAKLEQARKVSFSSISISCDKIVCIDHIHFGGLRVLHIMDSAVWYLVGAVVEIPSMAAAIFQHEAQLIFPFLYSDTVLFGPTFDNEYSMISLKIAAFYTVPYPPQLHNKMYSNPNTILFVKFIYVYGRISLSPLPILKTHLTWLPFMCK